MKSLFLLFVVVAYFATGEALKCYSCANPPDAGCDTSSFNKNAVGVSEIPCPMEARCIKQITKKGSEFRTSRGCIVDRGELTKVVEAIDNSLSNEPPPQTYFCDTDLCNGASSITAALSTLMALAVLLIFRNY